VARVAAVTDRPSISVVIPTYQRRASVLRALQSLANQTVSSDQYQVVVAVDGSTDGTTESVRSFATPYSLSVLSGPNRGRARACNAGIQAAEGTLVVLLDDDMEATRDFLAGHLGAHQGSVLRAVVGAAPIVVSPEAPPFVRYMAKGFSTRLERLAQSGYRLSFRDAYTGNFSVRRDVLLGVGGFDEAFDIYGHEDYELALRLQNAGVQLTYSADALARQHYEKTFAAFAKDGIARGRTAVLFAGKHPEIVDRIKLSEYHSGARTWRVLRWLLLKLGRVTRRVPVWVVWGIGKLERWNVPRLEKFYTLAVDYLYWFGAFGAVREQRLDGVGTSISMGTSHTAPVAGKQ
jgi:GT2 family glycosyltransferase